MTKAKINNPKPVGGSDGGAFYMIPQLAERWALSQRQVHRFLASGALVASRFGRSVRISAEAVARFEAERAGK